MNADFPVIDNGLVALVNEFNGILNGQDVFLSCYIRLVHNGGKGRGFPASRRPRDQNQASGERSEPFDYRRQAQLLTGEYG